MSHGPAAIYAWLAKPGDGKVLAGGAFLLRSDLAVTCAHVVREHLGLGVVTPAEPPAGTIQLRFPALDLEREAHVIPNGWFNSPETGGAKTLRDVALLRLVEPVVRDGLSCVPLATSAPPSLGIARIWGAAPGWQYNGQEVEVKLSRQTNFSGRWQLMNRNGHGFATEQGFSGAPLFNDAMTVLWGMVQQVGEPGTGVTLSLGADRLQEALHRAGITLGDHGPSTETLYRADAERHFNNIPWPEPRHFRGVESLTRIQKELVRPDGSQSVIAVALHGMRGVGKTTLAAVYARRHDKDYQVAWWINAEDDAALKRDLISLGVALNWVSAGETAVEVVLRRLASDGDGILLIYDNAPSHTRDFEKYLPKGGAAHVLITSNDKAWGGIATPVYINVWSRAEGGDYLCKRVVDNRTMREDAEDLSGELEGLPLALEHAAAYCEQRSFSFHKYIESLRDLGPEILDDKDAVPSDYSWTVVKTLTLAIKEIAKRQKAADVLIVLAALLAPEPIPVCLFPDGCGAFDEPLATQLGKKTFGTTFAVLRRFALVYVEQIENSKVEVFRLHRLVRDIAASMAREFEREIGLREAPKWLLLRMIQQALSARHDGNDALFELRLLGPHARHLIKQVTTSEISDEDRRRVHKIALRLGRICQAAHDPEEADELLKIAVDHTQPDTVDRVSALVEQALHNADGLDVEKAEQLFGSATDLIHKGLEVPKPLYIKTFANHGRVLQNLGCLQKAKEEFDRVVGGNAEESDLESQMELAWAKLHHRQFIFEHAATHEERLEASESLVKLRTEVLGASYRSCNGYTNLLAWVEGNLGLFYFRCNETDKARDHIMKARDAFLKLDNIIGRGWSALNLAKIAWRTETRGVTTAEAERRQVTRERLLQALEVFYDYGKDRMLDRRSIAYCFDAMAQVFEASNPEFSWILVKNAERLRDENKTQVASDEVDENKLLWARLTQTLAATTEIVDNIPVREIMKRLRQGEHDRWACAAERERKPA